ncbi:MAG TPA: vanadium-dependent haloperoxidase [Haliangiales bacterium]|nr:vanadium-dependent haloperoxidase [Haliangiales bacterium]
MSLSRTILARAPLAWVLGAWLAWDAPAAANVITDWDEKAVALVPPSPAGERIMALVHVAMFDAVNSIGHRYRPYLVQLGATADASKESAAASAAAAILAAQPGQDAGAIRAALASYLASIADGPGKAEGIKLGEAVAAKVLAARANDGGDAPDDYRPETRPGRYVPTALTVGSTWPRMRPFALAEASQFRAPPPVALTSPEWAAAYNEIKDYGGKTSTKRSPQQTETARFWLMVGPPAYHPVARQIARAKGMDAIDTARLMALYSVALTDAYIAVFDSKYHYQFWRPLTAIRNGDIDDNPATTREPTWSPIDTTPMHPEYPCAHCIESGAATAVLEAMLGSNDIPEVAMTSATAAGVTHRWTSLRDFADEIAEARIWAGFHYRFSTVVGRDMGQRIGRYVVRNVMQVAK